MRRKLACPVAAVAVALVAVPSSWAARPAAAALQVALDARGFYSGALDGRLAGRTHAALRRFQRRAGLPATGVLDRRSRLALGALGRPLPGKRLLDVGMVGWDVSVLEWELARRGFDTGRIDGRFDGYTADAVRRFRSYAGLRDHCVVPPALFGVFARARVPRVGIRLDWPLRGRVTAGYGLEAERLHGGIDITAPFGVGVAAAADGRVAWAGWRPGGLGLVVRLVHRTGVETVYAHLSRVDVNAGQKVVRGAWLGLVGRTGRTAKPQLHFEVRVRGAAVDPISHLPRRA